jgi:choloylglycine hydrolase
MMITHVSEGTMSKGVSALLLLLAVLTHQQPASACTEVVIRSAGHTVVANSLEAGDSEVALRVSPSHRGSEHGGHSAGCLKFTAKYGFIHGMNEAGLCYNEHALDLAVFQKPLEGTPNLCKIDFGAWVLGMHSTVAEVAAGLRGVRVVGGDGGQWGIHDALGHSIVVEFVKGELRLHNNTAVGVMTNDPTWDWHLQNVNNYVALQPGWYGTQNQPIEVGVGDDPWYPWAHNAYDSGSPTIPSPIGHAYNQLGLPGDGSPPSRFIRAFFLRQYALLNSPPGANLNKTLILGQELLNAVYKPLGTVASRGGSDSLETVPLSTLKVPERRLVYTRSRQDMSWRALDLKRLDFSSPSLKTAQVSSPHFSAVDVTQELL